MEEWRCQREVKERATEKAVKAMESELEAAQLKVEHHGGGGGKEGSETGEVGRKVGRRVRLIISTAFQREALQEKKLPPAPRRSGRAYEWADHLTTFSHPTLTHPLYVCRSVSWRGSCRT